MLAMNYTNEQINSAFDALPEELQDFIMASDSKRLVEEIIQENNIPDAPAFRKNLFLHLVGLMSIDDFASKLGSQFSKSDEESDDILLKLNDAILDDASDLLEYSQSTSIHPDNEPAEKDFAGLPIPMKNSAAQPELPSILSMKLGSVPANLPTEQVKFQEKPKPEPYKGPDPYREAPEN